MKQCKYVVLKPIFFFFSALKVDCLYIRGLSLPPCLVITLHFDARLKNVLYMDIFLYVHHGHCDLRMPSCLEFQSSPFPSWTSALLQYLDPQFGIPCQYTYDIYKHMKLLKKYMESTHSPQIFIRLTHLNVGAC